MRLIRLAQCAVIVLLFSGLLTACGGGGGGDSGGSTTPPPASPPAPPPVATTYLISGSLSGLGSDSSVVLQNNGVDNLTVSANGTFQFATRLSSGGAYRVSVLNQPTNRLCTVESGSGMVASAAVSNVAVSCREAVGLSRAGGSVSQGGLTIVADPGAVRGDIRLVVASQPNLPRALPNGFAQIGPVYDIDVPQSDQDKINLSLQIRIPIPADDATDGQFMALHFDETTNTYQPLTIVELIPGTSPLDGGAVIVESRSFSLFALVRAANSLVSGSYTTGFSPQTDSFNIQNLGFAYLSEGNCLGMSAYAAWYFAEERAGGGALTARFPKEQIETVLATRAHLAMSQEFAKYQGRTQSVLPPGFTLNIIKAGLRFSPIVLLMEGSAKHAVMAYGFDDQGIDIYDPNYPKTTRRIVWNGGLVNPYVSNGVSFGGFSILGMPSIGRSDDYDRLTAEADAGFESSEDIQLLKPTAGATIEERQFELSAAITGSVNPKSIMVAMVGSTPYEMPVDTQPNVFTQALVLTPTGRTPIILLAGIPELARVSLSDWVAYRLSAAMIFDIIGPDASEASSYVQWNVDGVPEGIKDPCVEEDEADSCSFDEGNTQPWVSDLQLTAVISALKQIDISITDGRQYPSFHESNGVPGILDIPLTARPTYTLRYPIDTVDLLTAPDDRTNQVFVGLDTFKYGTNIPAGSPATSYLHTHSYLADYSNTPGYVSLTLKIVPIGTPETAPFLAPIADIYAEGTFAFMVSDVAKTAAEIGGFKIGPKVITGSYRIKVDTCQKFAINPIRLFCHIN